MLEFCGIFFLINSRILAFSGGLWELGFLDFLTVSSLEQNLSSISIWLWGKTSKVSWGWVVLYWVGLCWVELSWVGLDWVALFWVGLNWVALGSVKLSLVGLDWVWFCKVKCLKHICCQYLKILEMFFSEDQWVFDYQYKMG